MQKKISSSIFDNLRTMPFSDDQASIKSPLTIKRPTGCDLLIAEKCNLRCKKCYFWKNSLPDALSVKECKRIIDSLSKIGDRPFEINVGGGEPLLIPGIVEVIRYCAHKGLHAAISTNATLIDDTMAKQLAHSGISRLSISLDSLDEKKHDFITGVDGSYRKVMQGIENLSKYWKYGYINIHTVLSALNIDDIIDLVEWVQQYKMFCGINIQAVAQPFRTHPIDKWYETEEYGFLWPKDIGKVHDVLDALIEFKKREYKIINPLHQFKVYKVYYEHPERFARKFRCNFGDTTINVNALGLMHLCCFMEPLGSVRADTVEMLWSSPQAETTRFAMYNCRQSCNNIMNCFFQEEDIEAEFVDEIRVKDNKNKSEQLTLHKPYENNNLKTSIKNCRLLVTPECAMPCRMCFTGKSSKEKNKKKSQKNGLSAGEWRWIIDSLSRFSNAENKLHLTLSGGEPLLFKGIDSLIASAHAKNIFTILETSCYPMNGNRAQKIAHAGLDRLCVSLDSHQAKTHDYLRGRGGVYKRVMQTVLWFHGLRPTLEIYARCFISQVNMSDILPFVDCIENDKRFAGIDFQALVQPYDTPSCNYWYRLKEYSFLWPNNHHELNGVLDELIKRKEKGSSKIINSIEELQFYKYYYENPEDLNKVKKCTSDNSSIVIDWLGYVSYCESINPLGNVHDFHLEQLLSSTIAQMRCEEMHACNIKCSIVKPVYFNNQHVNV